MTDKPKAPKSTKPVEKELSEKELEQMAGGRGGSKTKLGTG
jgi:hypothetical protein